MAGDLASVESEAVWAALDAALAPQLDVVALLRRSRAAGSQDWFLLTATSHLDELLSRARPDDSLALFLARRDGLVRCVRPGALAGRAW